MQHTVLDFFIITKISVSQIYKNLFETTFTGSSKNATLKDVERKWAAIQVLWKRVGL